MAEITVAQLAKLIKIEENLLLEKFKQSGVDKISADDLVSDAEKNQLLSFIQSGQIVEKKTVTLQRKTTKQLKVSGNRKVNIEVRKKKTIVQPEQSVEADNPGLAEFDNVEAENTLDEQAQVKANVSANTQEKTDDTVSQVNEVSEEVLLQEEIAVDKNLEKQEEPKLQEVEVEEAEINTNAENLEEQQEEALEKQMTKASEQQSLKKPVMARPKVPEKVTETAKEHPEVEKPKESGFRITSHPDVAPVDVKKAAKEKAPKTARNFRKAAEKPKTSYNEGDRQAKKSKSNRKQASRSLMSIGDEYGASASRKGGKNKKLSLNKVKTQQFTKPVEKSVKQVVIFEGMTVNELAQKMAVKAAELIKILMKMGVMATINQSLDQDTAILIVEELGHEYALHKEDVIEDTVVIDSSEHDKTSRAPVVTIMGHVDHGKTSLLDYIRKARVAVGEAGGITQHIGAYSVETEKGQITFLDTPGHEAFTAMRARGASSTDIVILVVAADDGVMPQTIEAVQHARAAGVPVVVAINKIDKDEADPDRVKNELSQHDVIPEDWGGDVMFAHVSAKSGEGVDQLLDAVLLQAEVLELKAVQQGLAKGVVVESKLEKGRGAVATVLVQSGLLKQGDIVLCGTEYGRIRAMHDDLGRKITSASVSMPVEILGLSGVPDAGDEMIAVKDDKTAREVAEFRSQKKKDERLKQQQASKLSSLFDRMGEANDEVQTLNVILKADVQGSVEAIRESLTKLSNDDIKVDVIATGIGGITSSDVSLALASQAVLFGFNVRADSAAKKQAETEGVELRYYRIIYDLIDDVKQAMTGMLSPELREEIIGVAEVRDVFRSSKFGSIAGCMVIDGVIKRNNPIRVLRDQVVIYEGSLESLKRFKEDANEVKKGVECGIGVKNYNDVKVGDQIEVFETVEIKREL